MDQILLYIQNYKLLAFFGGTLLVIIETFLPILPLTVLVGFNALILGLWLGFAVSWVGSGVGSILVFLLANKFRDTKIFKQLQDEKIRKFTHWVKKQNFNMIFVSYACPFIPDFLITITSGFSDMKLSRFIPGMLAGKFVMFLIISYVGQDVMGFLKEPYKVFIFLVLVLVSWILGKKVTSRIEMK